MAQKDEFGRHEILDRAHIVQGMFEIYMIEHRGLKPDEKKLAKEISDKLSEFYLLVGKNNFTADDVTAKLPKFKKHK